MGYFRGKWLKKVILLVAGYVGQEYIFEERNYTSYSVFISFLLYMMAEWIVEETNQESYFIRVYT